MLSRAGRVLLLFDYDGTLTPIVERPDLAVLAPETKALLAGLHRNDRFIVGIVSGRSLDDIRSRVGVSGLVYAGNHGLEIQGPDLDFTHPAAEELRETLGRVYAGLREELVDAPGVALPGVFLEDKGLTLSFHYRSTPREHIREVEKMFAAAVAPFLAEGLVRVSRGKMVLEVRPKGDWSKGTAITKIGETYRGWAGGSSVTVFFGDDVSDEDGFAVVQEWNGIAVMVGPAGQPTKALYRLDSPQEVVETLRLLAQL
ncbi:MAG: trehalose-phosphatase [Chloroflexi bacterium]|nr:trehalose-phosphatase [Chloroflexota bacterium]MCI0845886.1 trehalose-phosphatase [Chloroflexota bacterium]